MQIDFHSSERSTLGVEWEVALVERESGELAPRGQEVLDALVAQHPQFGEGGTTPMSRASSRRTPWRW